MKKTSRRPEPLDVRFRLVTLMYHALHAVEGGEQDVHEAERSGDQELVEFFRDVRERNTEIAERARRLLLARVNHQGPALRARFAATLEARAHVK